MTADPRLVDLFLNLTAIEGPSGGERGVADYIKAFLRSLGLGAVEDQAGERIRGNAGNVICPIGDGGRSVLVAHMDTAVSTQGLKAKVLDDRITSDGTTILGADDRAGIAAILYALETCLRASSKAPNVTLAFTVDEERDLVGSKTIELDKKIRMGFAFDSHLRPGHFIYRTYGAINLKIKVIGEASHASRPEKGTSAIQIASAALSQLRLGRIDEGTTANIGFISGGTAVNTVPEEVDMTGEVRSLEADKLEAVLGEIQSCFQVAAKQFGGQVQLQSDWVFQPYEITPKMDVRRTLEVALKKAGLEPKPQITAGGSDANNLNARGIPAVNIGIGAQNPHSSEEFILLEDLQKTADIARELLEEVTND